MIEVKLESTCYACPEAYDVYVDGSYLGYLRLRHGYFHVEDETEVNTVWSAEPSDSDGRFSYEERQYYIPKGIEKLLEHKGYDLSKGFYSNIGEI